MAEIPFLFSGPMIRALQARIKTQTRRLAKAPRPRAEPGDLIWVRETWAYFGGDEYLYQGSRSCVSYRADAVGLEAVFPPGGRWRSAIFMPRWAARFFLPIVSVRAERLLDITEEDALAEGITKTTLPLATADGAEVFHVGSWPSSEAFDSSRAAFLAGWDRINPQYPASANPVVWRYEFELPQVGEP